MHDQFQPEISRRTDIPIAPTSNGSFEDGQQSSSEVGDPYWLGYFDGLSSQSRIDLLAFWGVSLLTFLCGIVIGMCWHGV